MPPAVREGYEKARRSKTGQSDSNPFSALADMFGGRADDRMANLGDIIKKAKEEET